MRFDKKLIYYRFEQVLIIALHLILLKWMFYVLSEGGAMKVEAMILHFAGMAVYGAGLIRFCAYWAKRKYLKSRA